MTKRDERAQEILVNAAWLMRAHKAGVNVLDALTFTEGELRQLERAIAEGGEIGLLVREAVEFRREVRRRFCSALDLTEESVARLASERAGGAHVLL